MDHSFSRADSDSAVTYQSSAPAVANSFAADDVFVTPRQDDPSAGAQAQSSVPQLAGPPGVASSATSPPSQPASSAPANPRLHRRIAGFSKVMMTSVLGSQKGMKISAPENPVHVTHVGYNNQTGQFTVSFC